MGGLEIGYAGYRQARADSQAWKKVKDDPNAPGFSGTDTSANRRRSHSVTGKGKKPPISTALNPSSGGSSLGPSGTIQRRLYNSQGSRTKKYDPTRGVGN